MYTLLCWLIFFRCNVFSGHHEAYNQDYFKCLWRRFKSQSKLIDTNHTLYSFRHSGAIEIYKRTGSLVKLQKVMGHSSLNVSLTYLRGLEVAELTEEDMPQVWANSFSPKTHHFHLFLTIFESKKLNYPSKSTKT